MKDSNCEVKKQKQEVAVEQESQMKQKEEVAVEQESQMKQKGEKEKQKGDDENQQFLPGSYKVMIYEGDW
jgi:hypothetical protein